MTTKERNFGKYATAEDAQKIEHNITSWFVSRCLKKMKIKHGAKAVLSYADNDHHEGIIYKACNFKYYGHTSDKKDFFIEQNDGSFIKHSRGKTKGIKGEWRRRSNKKRLEDLQHLKIYDIEY